MSDLFDAISRGDAAAVETALAAAVNVKKKQQGPSPFDAAMRAKQPAIARRPLEAGADARKPANYLCAAIQRGGPLLAQAVLEANSP